MLSKVAAVLGLVLCLFSVLFLGGLASAWWEVRAEKRAGQVPTRPAWDARDRRRAQGGWRGALSIWWTKRTHSVPTCPVCGRGPVVPFEADDSFPAGMACIAWESGDPRAVLIHDEAGGYMRGSLYLWGAA